MEIQRSTRRSFRVWITLKKEKGDAKIVNGFYDARVNRNRFLKLQ